MLIAVGPEINASDISVVKRCFSSAILLVFGLVPADRFLCSLNIRFLIYIMYAWHALGSLSRCVPIFTCYIQCP